MRILLDTHLLLWSLASPARLPGRCNLRSIAREGLPRRKQRFPRHISQAQSAHVGSTSITSSRTLVPTRTTLLTPRGSRRGSPPSASSQSRCPESSRSERVVDGRRVGPWKPAATRRNTSLDTGNTVARVHRDLQPAAAQGFSTSSPSPRKSAAFRVTRISPWWAAMAAICRSTAGRGRPAE